jgi:hypothetical protein
MVLQAMKSKGHSARFRSFCKSETMDAFLHACIDYFAVFFDVRKLASIVQCDRSSQHRQA